MSGLTEQKKAEQFAKDLLGVPEFKSTSGWFSRLKKREGIKKLELHGESSDADVGACERWIANIWSTLFSSFEEGDIYSVDETCVMFSALPDSNLGFTSEKAKGHKKLKDRITALTCVSMIGEKEMLLIIGKSEFPRCFKGINNFPHEEPAARKGVPKSLPFQPEKWENWLRIDEGVPTIKIISEEQLVGNVKAPMGPETLEEENDEVEEEEESGEPRTSGQMRAVLDVLERGLQAQKFEGQTLLHSFEGAVEKT